MCGVVAATLVPLAAATSASAASQCAEAPAAVYGLGNPSGSSYYTPSKDEATSAAASHRYTEDRGIAFHAATSPSAVMSVPVNRMYKAASGDFLWVASAAEVTSAKAAGYADLGVAFHASSSASSCRIGITRLVKGAFHRFASTPAERSSLTAAGWTDEGVKFFAAPGEPATTQASTQAAPAPAAPAPAAPAAAPAGSSSSAGSVPVGAASYAVPAGAVIVSPAGNDAAAGTVGAPVRTIAKAVALAPAGGTVVLRGGNYNETVLISKQVTLQNYPGEAAWMDGSSRVSEWGASGKNWSTNWTKRFDASPTFTQGAPDSNVEFYKWLNPSYPVASRPDQVFVDGVQQRQVASESAVVPGTFHLNEATSKLTLGTNPSGRAVDVTSTAKALTIRGAGTIVRGIGVRRFATSVPAMGAVTAEAPNVRLENVVLQDIATTGASSMADGTVFDRVTAQDCGLMGLHANMMNNLKFLSVKVTGANFEHFNLAPVSGGVKISKVRGLVVSNSEFTGNVGPGFWADQSVYSGTFNGNKFSRNVGKGLSLEISSTFTVVDNQFIGNGEQGLLVNNTNQVQVWNNTFAGNAGRAVELAQDPRRNNNRGDQAVDTRVPWPDPNMPWTLGPVTFTNNVVSDSGGNCVLCVEDYSRQKSGAQMGISSNGNVYRRASASAPTWLVVWSRADVSIYPHVLNNLDDHRKATGQDWQSQELIGTVAVDAGGRATAAATNLAPAVAQPLPAGVASVAGKPAGTKWLGAWS